VPNRRRKVGFLTWYTDRRYYQVSCPKCYPRVCYSRSIWNPNDTTEDFTIYDNQIPWGFRMLCWFCEEELNPQARDLPILFERKRAPSPRSIKRQFSKGLITPKI
jgi:hypothetical protein